jgi:pyridoxal 5'-phosphate synthase pdxT subunit
VTSALTLGVLALQGDVREHVRMIQSCGAEAVAVRDESTLARIDGLVIPGGESTTMSKLALRDGLMEPLRAAQRRGMPMYGSCAGMIMLAERVLDARSDQQTVGGLDVTVRRNAFGRQVDSFEADLDVPEFAGAAFPAIFIRAPWVESVGEPVEVLARVALEEEPDTIVAVRQGPLVATSFHPELTGDTRFHDLFIGIVRQYA